MKLGLIAFGEWLAGENRIFEPGVLERTEYPAWYPHSTLNIFSKFYPDDIFATLLTSAPDIEICEQLDAALYISTTAQDPCFVDVLDKVPCPVILRHESGYLPMVFTSREEVLQNKQMMDLCDLIITFNERSLSLYRLWTETPVCYITPPYPIKKVIEYLAEECSVPQYDILITYSPSRTVHTPRNGYTMAMVAQEIINTVEGFETAGVFAMTNDRKQLQADGVFLCGMGCKDIQLIPEIPFREALQIISKARVVIDLDGFEALGKYAIDCALARVPVIMSSRVPAGVKIYGDIRLQDPYDVDAAIETARLINDGGWQEEWLDRAYHNALQFDMSYSAAELEREVAKL